jgi:hypothetical protein
MIIVFCIGVEKWKKHSLFVERDFYSLGHSRFIGGRGYF